MNFFIQKTKTSTWKILNSSECSLPKTNPYMQVYDKNPKCMFSEFCLRKIDA